LTWAAKIEVFETPAALNNSQFEQETISYLVSFKEITRVIKIIALKKTILHYAKMSRDKKKSLFVTAFQSYTLTTRKGRKDVQQNVI